MPSFKTVERRKTAAPACEAYEKSAFGRQELARARAEADARAAESERQRTAEQQRGIMAGLTQEEIRKGEELVNWDFIKKSKNPQEFRDHLARFPKGVCERLARARLEDLIWESLDPSAGLDALEAFLTEFPDGTYATQAAARRDKIREVAAAEQARQELSRKDTEAWEAAISIDTITAYQEFLRVWPQGEHCDLAKHRIKRLKASPTRRMLIKGIGVGAGVAGGVWALVPGSAAWRILHDRAIRTFIGHSKWVWSAVFSPDGRTVLSGSDDGKSKLWDVATGKEIRTYSPDFSHTVICVAFSPDGRMMLTGGSDGTTTLWDIDSAKVIHTFQTHNPYGISISSVAFSPDGRLILAGGGFGRLDLWDAASGKRLSDLSRLTESPVAAVAFSQDGRKALACGGSRVVVWELQQSKKIVTYEGHSNWARTAAFLPDGKAVISGSADKTLRLWNSVNGNEIRRFDGHTDKVNSLAVSSDGRAVISGGHDKTLRLWDVKTGEEIRRYAGHSDWVFYVSFSPDGAYAISASADNTLKLWSLPPSRT